MTTTKVAAIAMAMVLTGCGSPVAQESGPSAAELRRQLPVYIGEATYRAGARIPVSVTNLTGRPLGYILLECGFFIDGRVVETTKISWANVRSSEMVTGTLLPDTPRADSIDCRPTTDD